MSTSSGAVDPELGPERPDAGARVDHEQAAAAPHLDARRMAAEFNELRPRRAGRATNTPEADLERVLADGHSPRHHATVTMLSRHACSAIAPFGNLRGHRFVRLLALELSPRQPDHATAGAVRRLCLCVTAGVPRSKVSTASNGGVSIAGDQCLEMTRRRPRQAQATRRRGEAVGGGSG